MLLPVTFRGAPFAVTSSDALSGRRIALHQYPGRDDSYAEDMGRAPRRFRLRGFVLAGDIKIGKLPVSLQRTALLAALEKKGPGLLTHPTLGALQVVVERFSIGEELDANRRSSVEIEFIEAGKQTYPSLLKASSGISKALDQLSKAVAIATKYAGVAQLALGLLGGALREDATSSGRAAAAKVTALAGDATALSRLSAVLPGSYGRFTAGGNAGLTGANASPYASSTVIADLVPIASALRAAVRAAASGVVTAIEQANLNNAPEIPDAIAAMIDALAQACADPADAIRLMIDLMRFTVPGAGGPMSAAIVTMIARSAAAALTSAVASYQPTSADDAALRIGQIAPELDRLATVAADAGEDAVYNALRQCRGGIVADLRARGATLAQIRSYAFGGALPSLTLAQNIYADASRADQLVTQVDPVHPLFMPAEFEALAA